MLAPAQIALPMGFLAGTPVILGSRLVSHHEVTVRVELRGLPRIRHARVISMPSLSSSPWIRGAPHSGLVLLICRIRTRISRSTDGRPDFERQRQNRRKP